MFYFRREKKRIREEVYFTGNKRTGSKGLKEKLKENRNKQNYEQNSEHQEYPEEYEEDNITL